MMASVVESSVNEPLHTQPLSHPDRGILRYLGGWGWWRFWWPLAVFGLDALTVATVRQDALLTESAFVVHMASLVAVVPIWVLGARPAIKHGHKKSWVRMWAAIASVAVSVGGVAVGAIARVVEASVVGNSRARIFISDLGETNHKALLGSTEMGYLYFGLPLLVTAILVFWFLVGLGRAGKQA